MKQHIGVGEGSRDLFIYYYISKRNAHSAFRILSESKLGLFDVIFFV